MNPVSIGVLSVCLLLSVTAAEAANHKTIRANTSPHVIKQASGDALTGVQEVIQRRREYPHYLFTEGGAPAATTETPWDGNATGKALTKFDIY